jgi:cytochrome P450
MLLGLHPKIMQRLREEHDRVFGPDAGSVIDTLERQPSKSNELQYTTAVIKETLRLFPIGFGVRAAPEAVYVLPYMYCFALRWADGCLVPHWNIREKSTLLRTR